MSFLVRQDNKSVSQQSGTMEASAPVDPRTRRVVAVILTSIVVLEGIPIVFAFRHLERLIRPQTAIGMTGALLIAVAYVVYAMRYPGIGRHLFDRSWLRVPAFAVAVVAGLVEEIYFRQVLMNGIQAAGYGPVVQVIASGLAFGAVHAVWGLWGGWRVARGAVTATSALGFALAVLYIVAGRSVVPCILSHFLINLALEPALLLSSVEARSVRRTAT